MFTMRVRMALPSGLAPSVLRESLDQVASELRVDLALREVQDDG
jgi:glycine cleavage system regulatory protein